MHACLSDPSLLSPVWNLCRASLCPPQLENAKCYNPLNQLLKFAQDHGTQAVLSLLSFIERECLHFLPTYLQAPERGPSETGM